MQPDPRPVVNSEPQSSKSVFSSKTVWILVIGTFLAPVLKKSGVEFSDAETQRTAETLMQLATLIGAVWARAKAKGGLHFTLGPGAVLLAFFALLMLTGCAMFRPQVSLEFQGGHGERAGISTDGKSVRFHGGIDRGGQQFDAGIALPLPRKHQGGLAK